MTTDPIKRHESLKYFSRKHHHGLLLSWKIKEGLSKKVAPERIQTYADWFWNTHLKDNVEEEQRFLYPLLPAGDKNRIEAEEGSRKLHQLFEHPGELSDTLKQIADVLERHYRFEDRVLFSWIQQTATDEQLKSITIGDSEKFDDNLTDEFWK